MPITRTLTAAKYCINCNRANKIELAIDTVNPDRLPVYAFKAFVEMLPNFYSNDRTFGVPHDEDCPGESNVKIHLD